MGLEPDLVRLYPRVEERDSPFLALAVETHQLAAAYRSYLAGGESPAEDEQQNDEKERNLIRIEHGEDRMHGRGKLRVVVAVG